MQRNMISMMRVWSCESDKTSNCCFSERDSCGGDQGTKTEAGFAGQAQASTAATSVPVTNSSVTIVDAVVGDERFSILAKAVTAAGLVETLQQDGPFTVFAPSNEAFAKLPEGTLDELLKPESKAQLSAILTYHVIAAKLMANDIESSNVETVNGLKATVRVTAAETRIDNARVVETDIVVANGLIHVIDEVLLPPTLD
ncbi:MAG: putative surface protein with fasciclin (FAS1) repeats [Planctomycetota bacterium]|jgi:uncharacterized surface protein with fasciclin (FAS1) repeats